jgi:NitT/TauT family transport system ATP-binding protein
MRLQVHQLAKSYTAQRGAVPALLPTSFTIEDGELVTLLGPSGCGKSTTLSLIAGLEEASQGTILLDGAPVTGPGRDRGMVFQGYTLFPWMTVAENARFSLGLKANRGREDSAATIERAASLLSLMGLGDLQGAYPRELSGGMKQRVAIVRALTNRPKVLLMDEPFGALDAQTREEMQELMLLLHAHERTTVLFVTHDVEEALYLSSRVLVFSARPGRIVRELLVPFGPAAERTPELKLTPEFIQCKRDLVDLLHPGAHRGFDRKALLDRLVRPSN